MAKMSPCNFSPAFITITVFFWWQRRQSWVMFKERLASAQWTLCSFLQRGYFWDAAKANFLGYGYRKRSCLYHVLQVRVCWREGVDTGKSHIWTVFTSPLCPRVLFCTLVLNLAYSDFTQQMQYNKYKRPVASSKPKTRIFLFDLFFYLDLLHPGHFWVRGVLQSSKSDYHVASSTPCLKYRNALCKLMT